MNRYLYLHSRNDRFRITQEGFRLQTAITGVRHVAGSRRRTRPGAATAASRRRYAWQTTSGTDVGRGRGVRMMAPFRWPRRCWRRFAHSAKMRLRTLFLLLGHLNHQQFNINHGILVNLITDMAEIHQHRSTQLGIGDDSHAAIL